VRALPFSHDALHEKFTQHGLSIMRGLTESINPVPHVVLTVHRLYQEDRLYTPLKEGQEYIGVQFFKSKLKLIWK